MSKPNDSGSACALAGLNVLSFSLVRPFIGIPTLQAEIDVGDQPAPSGAQTLSFTAPSKMGTGAQTFTTKVTILESRPHIGRATIFAIGGAGGLRATLPGNDYANVMPRHVIEDILGETEDADGNPRAVEVADAAVLAALDKLPPLLRWSRPRGTGRSAIGRLAEELRLAWRILETGQVWIGAPAWEAWKGPDGGQPYYIVEPNASGIATLALDAPDLAPGMTILPPDDQSGDPLRVSDVIHTMAESGAFRTMVRLMLPDSAGVGRSREHWVRAVRSALPPQDLRVPWRATVVSQDTDGLLGLRLEEGAPLLTLAGVPIWPGLPGYEVQVPSGAECAVEFFGGREDAPFVRSFAPKTAVTLLKFDGGTAPFVRAGDLSGLVYTGPGTLDVVPRNTPGALTLDGSGSPKFKG